METVTETRIRDEKSRETDKKEGISKNPQRRNPRWWVWSGVAVVVFLTAILFVVCRYYILNAPEDTKAFIAGFLGILTLAVIAFQAYIYKGQWDAMQEQRDTMQEQLGEIRRQADLAHESLTRLERPYVLMQYILTASHPDWDKGRDGRYWYSFHPVFSNSGNTPAKDMFIVLEYVVRDTPLPEGFDFPLSNPPIPAIIGSNGTVQATVNEMRMLDDVMLSVQQGTKYCYIWGKVTYRDNFTATPEHTTHFCNYLGSIGGNPLDPPNVDISFFTYSHHNSYD